MAQSNTRYFNTFFYEDPYVETLSAEEAWVFQTLILNPHNNVAGLYEISIRRLSQYTKVPEERVTAALMRLQNDGKIQFSNNWLALKNFFKNNNLVPTMVYKSFQLLKEAPKDKVQYIFADKDGSPENWVGKYIIDLEKGINQVRMSKHRAAIKAAEKNGLTAPEKPNEVLFTLEDFNGTMFNTIPPSLPPSLREALPLATREYKHERKQEHEYKIKHEQERECSTTPPTSKTPFSGFNDFNKKPNHSVFEPEKKPSLSSPVDSLISLWNEQENLPQYRFNSLNLKDPAGVGRMMTAYSFEEMSKAIINLNECWLLTTEIHPGSFESFMVKSLDRWVDDAKPRDRTMKQSNKGSFTQPNQPITTEEDLDAIFGK